jgi:hypothetical protein
MLYSMSDARGTGNSSSHSAAALDPETLAVAQRIRARQCVRVGLFPLHAGMQVLPTARRLALAFEALGDRVHVLDTESPPALAERSGTPDVGDARARSAPGEEGLAVRPEVPVGGDRPAALERALEDSSARFDRVLVAFGRPAVAGSGASLLYVVDGVVLMARPGGATEFRLHEWLRRIDPQRHLGVLLVE